MLTAHKTWRFVRISTHQMLYDERRAEICMATKMYTIRKGTKFQRHSKCSAVTYHIISAKSPKSACRYKKCPVRRRYQFLGSLKKATPSIEIMSDVTMHEASVESAKAFNVFPFQRVRSCKRNRDVRTLRKSLGQALPAGTHDKLQCCRNALEC